MYTAGELAKKLGVSARTVRFYDEIGIMCPISYSEAGYRIYDETSVERLQKILMLRFLDFSLEQIEDIMKAEKVSVRQSLKEQERLLMQKLEHMERVLAAVREAQAASDDIVWDKLRQIIDITQEREFVIEQYRDENNLNKRINIHDFSTAKVGFHRWMLDKLDFKSGMKILDIGCGNAVFWKTVAPALPENLEIHLTDYSEGMLDSAGENAKEIQKAFPEKKLQFVFMQKDAEDFSYQEFSAPKFDRIMANHMLYHVEKEKRPALYKTVLSLLKKDGIFSCSLIGQEHNRELHRLLKCYYPQIKIPSDSFTIFLETAGEELKNFFDSIEWWEHENDLLVPDAKTVYDYVASYSKEAAEILKKDKERFLKRAEKDLRFEESSALYIHKATGVVVCRL